ncbi:MAG: TonB family protein, partial [Bacteroidales bacterium]|nr:TonB family protein [Bacteroidales bacterium]
TIILFSMRKILILFFAILIGYFASSQNMSIESFRCIENDINARVAKIEDINGELCALIILNTIEQGFEFSSCNIEKTEQKTGEIWIFVSPGVKFITIKHREFGTIRNYPFPQSIKSGTTYEMKLSTARIKQVIEERITEQYLIIESQTPDAKIYINDEYVGRNRVSKFLPISQEHSYRIESALYHTKSGKVKLNESEKTTLNIDLEPAFGYLKINTTPENDAEIEINGELQEDKTPLTSKKLKSGTYTVQAFKSMFESQPISVKVEDGKTTEININLVSNSSIVEITCQDKDAEIYIDGTRRGEGEFKGQLKEGMHRLEVKKANHLTFSKSFTITKSQNFTEHIAKLEAIYGKLNLNSTPDDANIYIDGEHMGKTPMIITQILIGNHNIKLQKQGYKNFESEITIEENKIADYNFVLKEIGSETENNVEIKDEDLIFKIVEEKPIFPGGQAEMMKYISKNLIYPQIAKEIGIQGRVIVSFVIEKDGSLTNIKVAKDIGGNCGEEAVRIIKSMPKWTPGKNKGKVVRTQISIPIIFSLR